LRRIALIGTAFIGLTLAPVPGRGQMIVYDPSNYAQNVLQAARALQQINNQITGLQNQTQICSTRRGISRACRIPRGRPSSSRWRVPSS
jgi:P-type conjugative transfer protein TrbJ